MQCEQARKARDPNYVGPLAAALTAAVHRGRLDRNGFAALQSVKAVLSLNRYTEFRRNLARGPDDAGYNKKTGRSKTMPTTKLVELLFEFFNEHGYDSVPKNKAQIEKLGKNAMIDLLIVCRIRHRAEMAASGTPLEIPPRPSPKTVTELPVVDAVTGPGELPLSLRILSSAWRQAQGLATDSPPLVPHCEPVVAERDPVPKPMPFAAVSVAVDLGVAALAPAQRDGPRDPTPPPAPFTASSLAVSAAVLGN
jgi:hypothetical protein